MIMVNKSSGLNFMLEKSATTYNTVQFLMYQEERENKKYQQEVSISTNPSPIVSGLIRTIDAIDTPSLSRTLDVTGALGESRESIHQ